MSDRPIPRAVEDLTPAWLAAALEVDVHRVEVLAAHSGTTGRVRLRLLGVPDGAPETVFVKLAPFDERQRRFVDAVGLGVAEARFYRDLAPTVAVRVPAVWHAALDGDRYVMVLEDLVASGARFPRPEDPDLAELVGALMDELALLHAPTWGDPELLAGPRSFVGEGARLAFGAGGGFLGRAVAQFAGEQAPGFARLGALYAARAPDVAALWERGPRTLAHGDPHLGNLFVDRGRPGFFDWGMVMPRAGMWDVAYLLCGSVPRALRRARERDWIDRYRAGLARQGVALDAADAWDQYRLFAVYAWVSATTTAGVGERFQRAAVARAGMARATAAIEDLDALGALEARLGRGP